MVLLIGFVLILLEAVEPLAAQQLPATGAGNSIVSLPGSGSASTTTTNVSTTVVNVPPTSPEEVAASARLAGPAMLEAQATDLGSGSANLATQLIDLPDFLTSRPLDITVNFGPGVEINNALRIAALILLLPALTLLLLKHLAGPWTGADPIDLIEALPIISFWSIAAWFNRPIQELLLTGANALFKIVGSTVIHDAVTPGLSLASFVSPVIGALLLLAFSVVVLIVVGKLYGQLAWVTILCACAPIFWVASATPVLDRYGRRWWTSWGGSVMDPLIVLVALKLGTPLVGTAGNATDIGHQFLRLIILLIAAFRAPGFFQGAMAGSGLNLFSMWAQWRMATRHYGGATRALTPAASSASAGAATPTMPPAGTAWAATWKSASWTPGGLGPHGRHP